MGADTILFAPLGTEDTQWTRRLGWAMESSDLSLLVSPSLVEVAGPRLSVEPVEGLAFVRVDMPRFSGPGAGGQARAGPDRGEPRAAGAGPADAA